MQQPLGELASFGCAPGPSRQLNSVFASSQQRDVGTAADLAEVTSQTLQLFPEAAVRWMRTERQVDQKAKGSIAVSEPEECAVQRS